MADYTIIVTNGSVSPETLQLEGQGAKTIEWRAGSGVSRFKITGLDPSVFSPSSSNGFVPSFTTRDANGNADSCTYNVQTEDTNAWDPRIENDGIGSDPPDRA